MLKIAFLALFFGLAGCTDIPRDPERTESLVRKSGSIRLGLVEGVKADEEIRRSLASIMAATGGNPAPRRGDTETLLADLRDGKIDLVFGEFADDSPWAKEVYLSSPPGWRAKPPKTEKVPRFAMRNGENGWIMLVERAIQQ